MVVCMNNDHALLFACEKGEINAVKCLVQTKNDLTQTKLSDNHEIAKISIRL